MYRGHDRAGGRRERVEVTTEVQPIASPLACAIRTAVLAAQTTCPEAHEGGPSGSGDPARRTSGSWRQPGTGRPAPGGHGGGRRVPRYDRRLYPTTMEGIGLPCRRWIGWRRTGLTPGHLALPRDDPDGRNSGPGEKPGVSRSGRAPQTQTSTDHRQSPPARPPGPPHKHCKRLGNSVRALVSGPWGDPPARPIPLSPAPCDTPPRVGPRGTGLFSRRCAWATNRPCDGRYPTR